MFEAFLEECVSTPDGALDELLRANELKQRQLDAERAALVGVIESKGSFQESHRSMPAYLRATVNTGPGAINRDRKLAKLVTEYPHIGEALHSGRISADHALEIGRLHANPRVRDLIGPAVPVLVELAEHSSHREFAEHVTDLIVKLDQDGAFDDLTDAVDGRRATVVEVGGQVVVGAHGGDPVQAAHMVAIFEAFAEREYQKDLEARRAEHGDAADEHPLPRSAGHRGFDALFAIFAAAYASPEGERLPELVTNLIVDADTAHEALATAGIVMPNADQVNLDSEGEIIDEESLLADLAEEFADDPEAVIDRRCETASGTPIHSAVVLRALLTGHVRRVVMDSQGVVIDYGTKQRLFTGLARQAAMLIARRCEHPGCELPVRWSQVDHNVEWSSGGPTDQRNRNIECGPDNRRKHRQRLRTRRNARGRAYTLRPDGTIILPVGERPPDLSLDETRELVLARLEHDPGRRGPKERT